MGREPQRPRRCAMIPESLNKQLNLYALAAGAGGIGLAICPAANAQIVFTPANVTITAPGGSYDLDLNNDGVADFLLRGYGGVYDAFIDITAAGANGAVEFTKTCTGTAGTYCSYAQAVVPGAKIPGRRLAQFVIIEDANAVHSSFQYRGVWKNVKNRYLGLKFSVNGETHYGWARMSVQVQQIAVSAHISGYAYESTPNKSIRAGDRGTLGALAVGAQ